MMPFCHIFPTSGVWFMKNSHDAHMLVREWEAKQAMHSEMFGEQVCFLTVSRI